MIALTDTSATDRKSPVSDPPGKQTVFFGKGIIAVILGIIALLIILFIIATSGSSPSEGTIIPPRQCADRTVQYVNTYLVQPGYEVSLVSVQETSGLYEMKVAFQSQDISLYTSKDCSLLFQNPFDMNAVRATPTPTKAPVKTARPSVELYVMSFCPYGTQAVTVLRPVYDLLGSSADIRVRYITTAYGETIESMDSLHGINEVKEDLWQICIIKKEEEHYWEYLRLFNEQCYPLWQDSARLEDCRANVTANLGIDTTSVTACTTGTDGLTLLRADAADSVSSDAWSSPTLLINGVGYRGARTPEAYKQAICNSFEVAPPECSTVLSSESAYNSAGGCG